MIKIGVYGIFDSANEECLYIGQSTNLLLRWKRHVQGLKTRPTKEGILLSGSRR